MGKLIPKVILLLVIAIVLLHATFALASLGILASRNISFREGAIGE